MPTIIVDNKKGLFQKAATTANPAGTLAGHKSVVKTVNADLANQTLTQEDSGKIFLVGGDAGPITFPVGEAGWEGTFVATGSFHDNLVVSGAAASSSSTVTVVGTELGADASTDAVVIAADVGATFGTTIVAAGDTLKVKVLKANSLILMETRTAT